MAHPALSDPEIRLAMVLSPLTLSCGPNPDGMGKRLGSTGFAEKSRGPRTLQWCGEKVNGGLESAQLGGKNKPKNTLDFSNLGSKTETEFSAYQASLTTY